MSFSGLAKVCAPPCTPQFTNLREAGILVSTCIPHLLLSRQDFTRFALDYLAFGNAFIEERRSLTGKPLKLETLTGEIHRRGIEDDVYWYIQSYTAAKFRAWLCLPPAFEPDINQEFYGMLEYLSALHPARLNESATLFRRKYYQNGAHAGYIMYGPTLRKAATDVERHCERRCATPERDLRQF